MKNNIFKIIFCIVAGISIGVVDVWKKYFIFLLIMMFIDTILGFIRSVLSKSNKSKFGGLRSDIMFRGGIKKTLILTLIMLGNLIDNFIFKDRIYFGETLIIYFIINEALSIIDNGYTCAINIQSIIYSQNSKETLTNTNDESYD